MFLFFGKTDDKGRHMIWNMWGPVSEGMNVASEGTNVDVTLQTNWGCITYIISAAYFSWLMDVKELFVSCALMAVLMFLGSAFGCITADTVTWLIHTGQILNGFAGPVLMAGPPLLSAIWFPAYQRTSVTSIAVMMGFLGVAGSLTVVSSWMVGMQWIQCMWCCRLHFIQTTSRVEELTTELEETRKLSQKKDLKLNSLISDIGQLKMKLSENEVTLSEFSDKEKAYRERERQLNATVEDVQEQLCHKAQELEVIKMDHAAVLANLNVKEKAVNDLTRHCNRLADENKTIKKTLDHMSRDDADRKEKETEYQNRIRILETALDDEKLKAQMLQKVVKPVRRSEGDNVKVTDGPKKTASKSVPTSHQDVKDNTNTPVPDRSFERDGANVPFICDFCQVTFPPHIDGQVIYDHWLQHERCCPICNIQFDPHVDQHLYEAHVAEHLATTRNYPDSERVCPVCNEDFSYIEQDPFEAHVRGHFGEW